ncbi:TPA: response regulator transcription factor [Stenotrophomonas maltophilia]|uniref:response regulator transcription factor n=1 Tax=Stenotrophomonas maltophilia group sp. Smal13 TaxID=3377166 RepID=UPI001312CABD|nr:response regulator transcription factor [Stenotrophomonas maltophilia]EKU9960282.1 response regulator transcription factor [Stenotrophomonas maltophilia]EKU9984028.1 response regulator transcription factor [Stenotrophomonas maltophilia]HEL5038524.1 response regulator transcription factor [Stenotrophomonas maltophilia]
MNIRIVIADDHPVILAGVRESLALEPGIEIVATAGDSTALVEALSKHSVDVVVTDFSMPGGEYGDGVAMLGFLRRRFPRLPVVVLTSISGVQVLASIGKTGVDCIVGKLDPAADLALAIRAAHRRNGHLSASVVQQLEQLQEVALTKREIEVLRMIAHGMTQKEIAEQLKRSRQTVSTQKHSAMRKLGLKRTSEIFDYALDQGMVSASQVARGLPEGSEDG